MPTIFWCRSSKAVRLLLDINIFTFIFFFSPHTLTLYLQQKKECSGPRQSTGKLRDAAASSPSSRRNAEGFSSFRSPPGAEKPFPPFPVYLPSPASSVPSHLNIVTLRKPSGSRKAAIQRQAQLFLQIINSTCQRGSVPCLHHPDRMTACSLGMCEYTGPPPCVPIRPRGAALSCIRPNSHTVTYGSSNHLGIFPRPTSISVSIFGKPHLHSTCQ